MSDVPSFLMEWEAAELFRQKTGLRLWTNPFTAHMVLDYQPERDYVCVLYGPYWGQKNSTGELDHDIRVFLCYRRLEGQITLEVLTQDADDDTFLNHNVIGTYDVGVVRV